jgi:hypothetical protein
MYESPRHEVEEARVAELERHLARLHAHVEALERRGDEHWQEAMRRVLRLEHRQVDRGEVISLFILAVVVGLSSLIAMIAIASHVWGIRV